MKNLGIIAIGCMVVLAGCQQAEEIEIENEELPMSIEASIGELHKSRYVSNNDTPNNLSFKENDEIGLFVHNRNVVKWTYNGEDWNPEKSENWPNKEDDFDFYAYYPYVAATSKDNVPMPSLAGQTGTIESLSKCDFLVASATESYGTDGTVSFTGTNAFNHISSLVAITIKGDCDLKTSTINKISFSAPDIASATTYSFSTGITSFVENGKSNLMEFSMSDFQMTEKDETFYFILNKGIALSDVTFSIEYSTDGTNYKAEKKGLGSAILASGNRYNFNLSISDGVLTFSGGSIVDWGEGTNMDDITISGVEQNNQDDENA